MGNETTVEQDIVIESDVETPQKTSATEGAKEASSPTPEGSKGAEESANGAAKPVSTEEPWHKSERFTKLTERARRAEEGLRAMQEKYEEILRNQARFNGVFDRNQNVAEPISSESREAAIKLARLLKEVAGEELGISQTQALREEINQIRGQREEELANNEFNKNAEIYSKKYGLSKSEINELFNDFVEENVEEIGGKKPSPGLIRIAFKAMFAGREEELKERETNLKLIKEKQTKTNQGLEQTAKGSASKNVKLESNLKDYLDRRVKEEGGEIVFD